MRRAPCLTFPPPRAVGSSFSLRKTARPLVTPFHPPRMATVARYHLQIKNFGFSHDIKSNFFNRGVGSRHSKTCPPPLLLPFLHERFDETSPRVPWTERKRFKKMRAVRGERNFSEPCSGDGERGDAHWGGPPQESMWRRPVAPTRGAQSGKAVCTEVGLIPFSLCAISYG